LNIARVTFDQIKHFNDLAPNNSSHIYEGKTPITWYGLHKDDSIVGCFGLLKVGNEARLRGWFVLPECRGHGYGTLLARTAEEAAQHMGAHTIEAKTAQATIMARLGWEFTGAVYKTFNGRQYRKPLKKVRP
jgi:N-acetylglutamate synthase-like GNAT family acetyltransferase